MNRTCDRCGAPLLSDAIYCGRCGEPIGGAARYYSPPDEIVSSHSRLVALILCAFLGYLGVHRFYVGKIFTGIIWLISGGFFGIGWIIDLILIATGNFRDSSGLRLVLWDEMGPGPGLTRA